MGTPSYIVAMTMLLLDLSSKDELPALFSVPLSREARPLSDPPATLLAPWSLRFI